MTNTEIEQIQARCDAASPGNWTYNTDAGGTEEDPAVFTDTPLFAGDSPPHTLFCGTAFWTHADGYFIAAARTDIPKLLESLKEARQQRDRAVELLRRFNTWAGTMELEVGERCRLLAAVSVFLEEVKT